MPEDSTVEDVMEVYNAGWKLGLKAIAIYRDGSKRVQPLSAGKGSTKEAELSREAAARPLIQQEVTAASTAEAPVRRAVRQKLPLERNSITHKFSIGGHEGYITVGMYEDGQPGEIFIVMAKEGSTVSGLMDSFATAISLALQYGVPVKVLVDKFSHTRFEPSGWTGHKDIGFAKSIMDYIFRWLGLKFLPGYKSEEANSMVSNSAAEGTAEVAPSPSAAPGTGIGAMHPGTAYSATATDAPTCSECGSIMTRNGSCYRCGNCGSTSGCS
jgi:ribonucleoside-diphosphate reductase alpha chain